jgi:hypothetical protein
VRLSTSTIPVETRSEHATLAPSHEVQTYCLSDGSLNYFLAFPYICLFHESSIDICFLVSLTCPVFRPHDIPISTFELFIPNLRRSSQQHGTDGASEGCDFLVVTNINDGAFSTCYRPSSLILFCIDRLGPALFMRRDCCEKRVETMPLRHSLTISFVCFGEIFRIRSSSSAQPTNQYANI